MLNSLQDVERLSQIVRALLLLSQAESGQVALQKTRLNLSTLGARTSSISSRSPPRRRASG